MKYLVIALALVAGSMALTAPSSAQNMWSFADGSTTPPPRPDWCPAWPPRC